MADSRYRNQYMQQGGAQQRMGLLDLFPSLGQWVQGNRDALMAPYLQRSAEQAQGLLGSPGEIMSAGGGGMLGQGDVQTQAPSGLMANPSDFFTQMQYAQGLMGTPGYESAGQNFASQALSHQLGRDARQQVQDNWQANQQRLGSEAAAANQARAEVQAAKVKNDYLTQSTGMASDAQAIMKPLRSAVQLYSNVNDTIRDKGFNGMSVTDDTVMVKTLAKLMLPDEAVMEGDIAAITTMEGIPAAVRGIARKLSMGQRLQPEERAQLYDQVQRIGQGRVKEYDQARGDFEGRAQRANFNVNDVLRSRVELNEGDYRKPTRGGTVTDPELIKKLNKAASEQDPNVVQQFGNWLAE